MTLKELKSLTGKNGLLNRQDEQIARMEAMLVRRGNIDTSGIPRNPTPRNSTEELMIEIIAAKEKRAELAMECERIEQWINSIVDDTVKLIFLRRFVDGMRWNDIAAELGGNNTEYSVKKTCYRYINNSSQNT